MELRLIHASQCRSRSSLVDVTLHITGVPPLVRKEELTIMETVQLARLHIQTWGNIAASYYLESHATMD